VNRTLWTLQILLALTFLLQGIFKFATPAGLPSTMAWMYDLPPQLKSLVGVAELLAAVGLIAPALTRIRVGLVSWAATGLVVTMVAAAVWHAGRGESAQIALNLVLGALAAFVAYGRWKLAPLTTAVPT
jgi:putative oxidoreductase